MVASLDLCWDPFLLLLLFALGALLFLPHHIFPEQLSSALVGGAWPYGQKVLSLACAGTLVCIRGAAVETALSGDYNLYQFLTGHGGRSCDFDGNIFHFSEAVS